MGDQKLTLVFFLGGVTQAEVAALRFLAQQDDGMCLYVECMLITQYVKDEWAKGSFFFFKQVV